MQIKNSWLAASLSLLTVSPYSAVAANSTPVERSENKTIFTPESILPAGVDNSLSTNPYTGESGTARKGTVAATLNNVALLNKALLEKVENKEQIDSLMAAISNLIPSLQYIGVFDLFTPEEWLSDVSQPGRILAALLYLEKFPQKKTKQIDVHLHHIQTKTKIRVITEKINVVLGQ